jgi:CubicO group peptidase (beta-lactamase class C family)
MDSLTKRKRKMIYSLILIVLFALASVLGGFQPAQTPVATSDPAPTPTASHDLATEIDNLFAELAEQDLFSGSVLVAKDGEVLVTQGYGTANLELNVPVTPASKFRIAELTWLFTAVAIMQLTEQDKLALDDAVCTYLEQCPEEWQPITIRHLLTFTAGIPEFTELPDYAQWSLQPTSMANVIERLQDEPLLYAAGEEWNYTGSNYLILTEVVRTVSGSSYEKYITDYILKPLKMNATGMDSTTKVLPNRASGYASDVRQADYIVTPMLFARGGLYSTTEDLYRFLQGLENGTILSPESVAEMDKEQVKAGRFDAHVGYGGWWIQEVMGHYRTDFAADYVPGYRSWIVRFPDDGIVFVILSNREDHDIGTTGDMLAKLLLGD